MSLWAAFRAAWRALHANWLRSALTMLGIVIGVAAVITLVAIGGGAQARVAENIRAVGANLLLIVPGTLNTGGVRGGASTSPRLTEDDARAIAREVQGVAEASPSVSGTVQVVAGNSNWATRANGIGFGFLEARDWPLAEGRMFDVGEMNGSAKVAILGRTVARELFGDESPLGRSVRVNQVPMRVIGVLDRKGQNASGDDQDDTLLLPISTFRNRIHRWLAGPQKRVYVISVKVQDGWGFEPVQQEIASLLRQRYKLQPGEPDSFVLRNLSEVLEAEQAAGRVMTLMLAAVAGVSLLVGGIGIMNIMLVSVTERTREIGLRMAVGARSRDILAQFLIEAVVLSLAGGAAGILIGAGASLLIGRLADWPIVLGAGPVLLAVGFSAAVGMFFGYYPARRAAALLPIEALRHE